MARHYRKNKNNPINIFFIIILLLLIGILCYKIYTDNINSKEIISNESNTIENNNNKKTNNDTNKKTDDNINDKEELNNSKNNEKNSSNKVTDKSSSNEVKENKNEQARRGGTVNLELIGEENIKVSLGSKYNDPGVKATYSDGSDASSEVEIDNAVDTSKKGNYTVSYYVGNTVIIRRVMVE